LGVQNVAVAPSRHAPIPLITNGALAQTYSDFQFRVSRCHEDHDGHEGTFQNKTSCLALRTSRLRDEDCYEEGETAVMLRLPCS
jgi:hypothetical protein